MVEDISGGEAEEGGGCGGAEEEAVSELGVRSAPRALRHATVFGAPDAVPAGGAMVLVAPRDPLPLPLLARVEQRDRGVFAVESPQRGPEVRRLRLSCRLPGAAAAARAVRGRRGAQRPRTRRVHHQENQAKEEKPGGHVMDGAHRRTGVMVRMAGAALMAAGPVMVLRGGMGRKEIRTELAAQRITFPAHGLPAHLAALAGRSVETGAQAHAYAELIKEHVSQATGGRTYAEITEELHATGDDDEKLAQLRQTAFMGETLRGSLLSAYQAWHLTTLVMGLGGVLTGLGAALVATADALGADPHRP
ncbi:DUF2249 domain-containing protein [Streptomyces sp. NPDC056112]|uniref:DUF2249 domain-containing protein n=1 Tax=unclassified Streptomyces TaxID=2593676 RepID=UPI001CD2EBDA|nr:MULTISPECIES: DUF2249 domain-containing protein [unclassified Streptomyces]